MAYYLPQEVPVQSSVDKSLEGHGIHTATGAYHTFVFCPDTGDNWQCHGQLYAPTTHPICGGIGNHQLAQCIEGSDEAGIYYMRTGVCHQIANRILAAAGVEIPLTSDPQVGASWLAFGKYGRNRLWVPKNRQWPDRWHLCSARISGASSGAEGFDTEQSSGINSSMTRPAPISRDPRSELFSLLKTNLGDPVDEKKFTALIEMREHLQDQIDHLSDQLMEHKLSPVSYLERLDLALIEASKAGEDILGYSSFHKVFGDLRIDKLGDAKVFLEQFAKGH